MKPIKIRSSATYLPDRIVTSAELDSSLGLPSGTAEKKSGVRERRYVNEQETAAFMGAAALKGALRDAHLEFSDLDLLVSASATPHQPLPCNAAFIQHELGEQESGIPCFDFDATCLSFMVALEQISCSIAWGQYQRVAIVTSEIASGHLNPKHTESATLFGDGAVAFIIERAEESSEKGIIASRFETYSSGVDLCGLKGGGSLLSPHQYTSDRHAEFCFQMNGRGIFKLSAKLLPPFLDKLFNGTELGLKDLSLVVPHQASSSAMKLMRKRLSIPEAKWMSILENHGNQIAASIPTALHIARTEQRITPGSLVLLLGTGAGLGLGAMVLRL